MVDWNSRGRGGHWKLLRLRHCNKCFFIVTCTLDKGEQKSFLKQLTDRNHNYLRYMRETSLQLFCLRRNGKSYIWTQILPCLMWSFLGWTERTMETNHLLANQDLDNSAIGLRVLHRTSYLCRSICRIAPDIIAVFGEYLPDYAQWVDSSVCSRTRSQCYSQKQRAHQRHFSRTAKFTAIQYNLHL